MLCFYFSAPIITLIPEVATVFSGQMDIVLMCTTNSDNLPVLWYSDSTGRVLSNSNTYRVQISDDIRGYNCSVEDPVSRTIVASKIVLIREVTGILCLSSPFYYLIFLLFLIRNFECLEKRWCC